MKQFLLQTLPLLDGDVVIFILVAVGILTIAGIAIYFGYRMEKKRREALAAWAASKGFSFSKEKDHLFPERFGYLDPLRQGSNRYAYNLMQGEFEGRHVILTDFHFETHSTDSKGNRQTHHHHSSLMVVQTTVTFPHELKLRPEGFFDKITALVGFDDIDFESNEFSKRFHVKASDKKFAYDLIHPRMMELLLNNRSTRFEVERDTIAFFSGGGRWKPETLDGHLSFSHELISLIPDYLLKDLESRQG